MNTVLAWVKSNVYSVIFVGVMIVAPIVLGILALGSILVVAEGSAIAPFIYALF